MLLSTLIRDLPLSAKQAPDTPILGVTDDSRRVQPGYLYIARPADLNDSAAVLRYLPSAIQAGAAAVLLPEIDKDTLAALNLPAALGIAVARPGKPIDQRLVGRLAERFHDHPSAKLKLIGITGTNGKTTTATLTQHLLNHSGIKCGLIGTVSLDTGAPAGPAPANLTSPGAAELSQLFADMVKHGCKAAVMEVSSHALHQGRADALTFAAAAFTNLTQDHLDYHGTMEAYADAKAMLFESLGEDATAVLNGDDNASSRMARDCKARQTMTHVVNPTQARGFGAANAVGSNPDHHPQPNPTATARPLHLAPGSSTARFTGPWGSFDATLPFVGTHNLSNLIQALTLAHAATALPSDALKQALQTCPPVPGRLEPVGPDWPQPPTPNPQLPTVLVDYAHTPDALINVGSAMRELTSGKLITVFGCGGDRDRNKRPLMAQAAQQYADVVILTSDNPRTEDPQQILNDAAAGFEPPKAGAERAKASEAPDHARHIIPDRAQAIRFAINLAGENDTVLIAGKGHEDYQIIGTTKHHFDDREQAAAALRERLLNQ